MSGPQASKGTATPIHGVRVAELAATLSYAADLGLGQPLAHCMRQTTIALRLADLAGASQQEREATYYLGLMMNTYCHADASEQARWFGDDIAFKAAAYDTLGMNTAQLAAFIVRQVASHGSGLDRARRLVQFPRSGWKEVLDFLSTHARLVSQFAQQIGLDQIAVDSFRQAYEQWDGKGVPNGLRGADIALPARLVQLAGPAEVYARNHGVDAARAALRRHRGADYDPAVVELFCTNAWQVLDGLDEASEWDAILNAEPSLGRRVAGAELDAILEAMADLADLKSPHFAGHSRGVASLAAAAGRVWSLPDAEIATLYRAGLVHDLGRLGVSNAIWEKHGSLTVAETEHVRLHPYLTERMLAGVTALAASREIAGRHHERLDGSGYPRGLTGAQLRPMDNLLATADAYHAMTEPRPHRGPLTPDEAADELTAEATAGRLDGAAVAAVLTAAGRPRSRRRAWPDGLTTRETEVLALLARGQSNRQIGTHLTVTPKTAANHVEHIYTKIGVSSRAAATLYAMQHGLVGAFEPPTD